MAELSKYEQALAKYNCGGKSVEVTIPGANEPRD